MHGHSLEYDLTEPQNYTVPDYKLGFVGDIKPNYTIQFSNDKGIVGTLDFSKATITFEGDVDNSAKSFFEAFIGEVSDIVSYQRAVNRMEMINHYHKTLGVKNGKR